MKLEQMQALNLGDVVRREGEADGYVVQGNFHERVTAVRAYDITNADEWGVGAGGIAGLRVGNVIGHKDLTYGYVVTGVNGGRATAVRSVDITDRSEWELVFKAGSSMKGGTRSDTQG